MESKFTTECLYSRYGVVPTPVSMEEMKVVKALPILQVDSNYKLKVTTYSTEISGLSL
jgi:hypothetical protein